MNKTIVKLNATEKLLSGAELMASIVGSTLGPSGKTVILEPEYQDPFPTKDGATVASRVSSSCPEEEMAIRIIRAAASNVASRSGDGTTTTTLLCYSLFKAGAKLMSLGYTYPQIKKGFEKTISSLIEYIQSSLSTKIKDISELKHIVEVSSSWDEEITSLIMEALSALGEDAVIVLADGKFGPSRVELHPGYVINRSVASSYFAPSSKVEYSDPLVLVTEEKISTPAEALKVMELAYKASKPLVVIADDIEASALAAFVVNHVNGRVKLVPLKAPSYGENRRALLQDIAIITKAKLLSSSTKPLSEASLEDLGAAEFVRVDSSSTVLISPKGMKDVDARVQQLKEDLAQLEEGTYFYDQLLKRIGMLTSKVATIHVFALSEGAIKERKARYEDAIRAVRCALQSGYVAGAYSSIIHALKVIPSSSPVEQALKEALLYPFEILTKNASLKPDVFLDKLSEKDYPFGLNVNTADIENLLSSGVIDPTSVVVSCLETALTTALMLISSSGVIHLNPASPPPYDPLNASTDNSL